MAGNQLGKTQAGACEVAYHTTGNYPMWWKGKRFETPTIFWVTSKSGIALRDAAQAKLMGFPHGQGMGTGALPKASIIGTPLRASGVPDLLDSVKVQHVSGGTSHIVFKTYDAGRERWQGPTIHGVWFDEEPPLDIYSEGMTRTQASGIFVFTTFTPLLGRSEVVMRFMGADHTDVVSL